MEDVNFAHLDLLFSAQCCASDDTAQAPLRINVIQITSFDSCSFRFCDLQFISLQLSPVRSQSLSLRVWPTFPYTRNSQRDTISVSNVSRAERE